VRSSFSACQANFRPLFAVYTGSSLQDLQPIAQSDNPVGTACPMGSGGLSFDIEAGTVYRLAVDGFDGTTRRFAFEIEASAERLPRSTPAFGDTSAFSPSTRIVRKKIRPKRGFAPFVLASSDPREFSMQARRSAIHSVWPCRPLSRFDGRHPCLQGQRP
jgi:hypothetical protein